MNNDNTTTAVTVVSAAPGWHAVFENGDELVHEPVLAWKVEYTDSSSWVSPIICSASSWNGEECFALQRPDGKYYAEDAGFLDTAAEVIDHLRWLRSEAA